MKEGVEVRGNGVDHPTIVSPHVCLFSSLLYLLHLLLHLLSHLLSSSLLLEYVVLRTMISRSTTPEVLLKYVAAPPDKRPHTNTSPIVSKPRSAIWILSASVPMRGKDVMALAKERDTDPVNRLFRGCSIGYLEVLERCVKVLKVCRGV